MKKSYFWQGLLLAMVMLFASCCSGILQNVAKADATPELEPMAIHIRVITPGTAFLVAVLQEDPDSTKKPIERFYGKVHYDDGCISAEVAPGAIYVVYKQEGTNDRPKVSQGYFTREQFDSLRSRGKYLHIFLKAKKLKRRPLLPQEDMKKQPKAVLIEREAKSV